MEEAQHAKLDTLIVESLARTADALAIDAAVEEYLEIGGLLDGALAQPVAFDIDQEGRRESYSARYCWRIVSSARKAAAVPS